MCSSPDRRSRRPSRGGHRCRFPSGHHRTSPSRRPSRSCPSRYASRRRASRSCSRVPSRLSRRTGALAEGPWLRRPVVDPSGLCPSASSAHAAQRRCQRPRRPADRRGSCPWPAWRLRRRRGRVMAVVQHREVRRAAAVEQARRMVADGADLLDVGGASTRPGHDPSTPPRRPPGSIPVVRALAAALPATPISIDTTSPGRRGGRARRRRPPPQRRLGRRRRPGDGAARRPSAACRSS